MKKARLIKTIPAIVVALLIVLVAMPIDAKTASSEEVQLLNLINEYRAQKGLGKLVMSDRLTKAAYAHSSDMGAKNYFSHKSLSGATFSDRIIATGYSKNTYLGENIAAGFSKASDVFNAWKASPGHNNIMLGKNFKAVGIGRAYNANSKYKWYWTADFGGIVDSTERAEQPPKPTQAPESARTPETAGTEQESESNNWAYGSIKWLVDRNVVSGYPDGTFKPGKPTTRAEFCVMIVKAFKIAPGGEKVFSDTADHWARDYVAALADRGYIRGYDDNVFRPDNTISRAEMVKIIVKAAKLGLEPGRRHFGDVANHWARDYIDILSSNGIVNGFPDGSFRPDTNTLRSDTASCIHRLLNGN